MAEKTITELQLIDAVTSGLNIPSDNGIQTYRFTAAQMKAFILAAGNVGTTELADLGVTTGKLAAGAVTDAKTAFTMPTIQKFLSGSGTYTTPAGVKYIRVIAVGGGAGGGGSGTSGPTNGSAGGATTFGSAFISAGGGGANSAATLGAGGVASLGSAVGIAVDGAQGHGNNYMATGSVFTGTGGNGGSSYFGGAGSCQNAIAGNAAKTNSGSGGGGGGMGGTANVQGGPGGAAGGFVSALVTSPSGTYSYAVGAGGAGGSAGPSGFAGGAGAAGMIVVEEYYV